MKQALFDHIVTDPAEWRARAEALRARSERSTDYALCERLNQLAAHYERLANPGGVDSDDAAIGSQTAIGFASS